MQANGNAETAQVYVGQSDSPRRAGERAVHRDCSRTFAWLLRLRRRENARNGASVHVAQVSAERLPGFYHIHVVPSGGTGTRGVHVFDMAPGPAPTRTRPSPRIG